MSAPNPAPVDNNDNINNINNNEEKDDAINLNLLNENLRWIGLGLMTVCLLLTLALAGWVYRHRKAPVVQAMQPVFLIMLCAGNIITNFTIVPLSVDDSMTSSQQHLDAACQALPWLTSMGRTLILSALFSKLWRVNQIFHTQGFQRKVITAKEMMWPFAILLSLNLCTVITSTVFDPRHWVREPVHEDNNNYNNNYNNNTVGYCRYDTWVGICMDVVRGCINFGALVILCVQAYRARDIRSEFSEARGVALALFGNAQAVFLAWPTLWLLHGDNGKTNVNAQYLMEVLLEVTTSVPMLLFIFGPLIAHHRQYRQRLCVRSSLVGNGPRVSGIALPNATGSGAGTMSVASSDGGPDMLLDLAPLDIIEARRRIADLEAKVKELNTRISDQKGPECRGG